jgi:hypothetical protein
MFAEADNEINGAPSGDAIAAFEQVRTRAFGGNPIGTTPADYTGFFNAIVQERAFEFAAEGIRKFDLIRWNMLSQKLQETKDNLLAMATGTAPYNNLPATMYYNTSTSDTGILWANPLDQPTPATQPSGTSSIQWAKTSAVDTDDDKKNNPIYNTLLTYYAYYFTPNKNELLPFATTVLQNNPKLTQNNY